jgi:hypothetical protein
MVRFSVTVCHIAIALLHQSLLLLHLLHRSTQDRAISKMICSQNDNGVRRKGQNDNKEGENAQMTPSQQRRTLQQQHAHYIFIAEFASKFVHVILRRPVGLNFPVRKVRCIQSATSCTSWPEVSICKISNSIEVVQSFEKWTRERGTSRGLGAE